MLDVPVQQGTLVSGSNARGTAAGQISPLLCSILMYKTQLRSGTPFKIPYQLDLAYF